MDKQMPISSRRLLIVLAHPDDESFGMAGTIAKYVSESVHVTLICTTNGDVGTIDPEFMKGYLTIAERRLAELNCAAEALSISRVITLGYRDSGMAGSVENAHPDCLAAAPIDDVVSKIAKIIRETRPQVVITFDPFGGYGHPDHLVTHRATVQAVSAAADGSRFREQLSGDIGTYQCQKLYFLTFDRRIFRIIIRIMEIVKIFGNPRKMGRNHDVDATEIVSHSFPIHASIDTSGFQAVADRARLCHESQLGGIGPRQLSQILTRLIFGIRETFMRSYPPVTGRLMEHDLFSGIQSD